MKNVLLWIKNNKGLTVKLAAILIIAVNQILSVLGYVHTNATNDQIYMIVSTVVTVGTIPFAAWKNFNFTQIAQLLQIVLDAVKDGKVTIDEVIAFVNAIDKDVETIDKEN